MNMRNIRYILLAVAVFASSALNAQDEITLTLEQARQQALENNKTLGVARMKIEKQKYDRRAVRANFFPNFNLMATDFYSTGKMNMEPDLDGIFGGAVDALRTSALQTLQGLGHISPEVESVVSQYGNQFITQLSKIADLVNMPDDFFEMKIGNVFNAGIYFTQPIYVGGKISTGYKMSKLGEQMAMTNVRLTESEVIYNTDQAYILCIRAKELGDVARSYRSLLQELQKNVDAAVKHGMKTRNDAMKVQVKLNEVELNILRAENAYRLAQMNLAHVCGIPITKRIEVAADGIFSPENFTLDGTDEDGNADLSNRPEHVLLDNKSEMARLNVKMVRSEFLPKLVMAAAGNYAHGLKFLDKTLMNNFNATVGVSLKVPLYHFGEGMNKVRSAKTSYRIAQMEKDDLNEQMQLDILQSRNMLVESMAEVDVTNRSVEQADNNVKMSRQQYEVGTEPLSDLLEAQAMWQQASASAVEARCQYLLSYTKYLKALGGLK